MKNLVREIKISDIKSKGIKTHTTVTVTERTTTTPAKKMIIKASH